MTDPSEDDKPLNDREPLPGDEAAPEEPSSGENVCPVCEGSGEVNGGTCPSCEGSGVVIEALGGG